MSPARAIDLVLAAIAELYRLTPTESLILRGVCNGTRPIDIARRRGVSPKTVYTQAKVVCRKMGEKTISLAALGVLRDAVAFALGEKTIGRAPGMDARPTAHHEEEARASERRA